MNDQYFLPVLCKGEIINIPIRLRQYGYVYKLEVEIKDTTILFEKDEDRNWRAVVPGDKVQAIEKVPHDLLTAIVASISNEFP